MDQVEQFRKNFISLYHGHGRKIERPNQSTINGVADTADAILKPSKLLGISLTPAHYLSSDLAYHPRTLP